MCPRITCHHQKDLFEIIPEYHNLSTKLKRTIHCILQ
uniref:Uncharacterized protein n=1 Tax=Arundo donax TaxID=35708 RepID=A0A0A8XY36_ARUDO